LRVSELNSFSVIDHDLAKEILFDDCCLQVEHLEEIFVSIVKFLSDDRLLLSLNLYGGPHVFRLLLDVDVALCIS